MTAKHAVALSPLALLVVATGCGASGVLPMSSDGWAPPQEGPMHMSLPAPQKQGRLASASTSSATAKPAIVPGQRRHSPNPIAKAPAEAQQPSKADLGSQVALDASRCPAEMVLVLDDVCVDKWESSLLLYKAGKEERSWSPFYPLKGAKGRLRAVSRPSVVPQAYISGKDAQRACETSGKRLCTAAEWGAACRGPKRTMYPYGQLRKKRKCNDDGRPVHPVAEVTSRLRLPADRMWYEGMEHPLINQLKNTLRKTGERAECTNDYGAYDMVGNLHEWIEDASGTFRGGFYLDTRINGEGCNYATTAHSFKYYDYSTGFRCCMDADPVE